MEVNHLRHFYAVAREQSFTKGAALLRVSQPSVSKLVKNLEAELGFPLFDRLGRNIRLTERGSAVFRHCQVIFGEIEKIDSLSGRPNRQVQRVSGTIRAGAAEAIASHLLPAVLARFSRRWPQVYPSVTVGSANDLCRRVADGQLDFGLFLHLPELTSDLEIRRQIDVAHRIVVSAKHGRKKSVLARFIGSREVEVTGTRAFPSLTLLRQEVPNAAIAISTNSATAQLKLVLAGAGVAVLPLFVCEDDVKKQRLRCLFGPLVWPLSVVTRKDAVWSGASAAFVEDLAPSK